jgi:hypothetical protein
MDARDLFQENIQSMRLFPYASNVYWKPDSNILGMTLQIYDNEKTQEFSFAFTPSGNLKYFLDQLELNNEEEND